MGEIFSQTGDYFTGIMLGETAYSWDLYGCVATNVLNALSDAGYIIVPRDFANALNTGGAFDKNGLLIWEKITEIYPQFHYGEFGYTFEKGNWGIHQHWLLKTPSSEIIDPWYGKPEVPAGWETVSLNGIPVIVTADITPFQEAPTEEPTQTEVPTPPAAPEAPVDPTYTVVHGDQLGEIVFKHYGDGVNLWGSEGEVAKVAAYNEIENPNYISEGQIIKFPTL